MPSTPKSAQAWASCSPNGHCTTTCWPRSTSTSCGCAWRRPAPAGCSPTTSRRSSPKRSGSSLAEGLLDQPWLERGAEDLAVRGAEDLAVSWAVEHGINEHLAEVTERVSASVARTRRHVRQRLTQEINHWDARHADLLDQQASGRALKVRPETAEKRARDLERRLERRLAELDADEGLRPLPPVVAGGALVVPQGLLDRLAGRREQPVATYAKDTAEVDRRAIAAALAAEHGLGREPEEMPHNNPGFDIRSRSTDGHWVFIEVKGRILGAEDFSVTRNEVLYAKNADRYRLVLVSVHPDGPERDAIRYVANPFKDFQFGDFAADGVRGDWAKMWARGT